MQKSFSPAAIRKRKWRAENTELYLKTNRERQWMLLGLDIDEANTLRNNVKACEICGRTNKLCVDHCHETGIIRGILCDRHNRGLGYFSDKPDLLRKAANYVERYKGN